MEQTMVDVAQAGDIDSLYILLQENPFVLNNIDKSPFSQTPLHIAVSSRQTRFAKEIANLQRKRKTDTKEILSKILAFSIEKSEVEDFIMIRDDLMKIKKEGLLNLKDDERNTVLHLAMIEAILCSNTTAEVCHVDVNATNMNNLTALDIFMLLPTEEGDEQVESAFRCAGAVSASQIITPSSSVTQPKRKLYMFGRVASKDLQNRTFLISPLVASICLFNIFHPPGGVWQVNLRTYSNSSTIAFGNSDTTTTSHRVGTAVMTTWPFTFYLFVIFNVYAFLISSIITVILTVGSRLMPFFLVELVLMYGALVLSIAFITPEEHFISYILPFLTASTTAVMSYAVSAWNQHKNQKASAARDKTRKR
ncbi:PGG domain [Dillenia turbinata]|uniref:PGG domain n=1 Tax=Dillenia turbinata TaxID=194707 RepID=A0AAN8UUX3_9MAGN